MGVFPLAGVPVVPLPCLFVIPASPVLRLPVRQSHRRHLHHHWLSLVTSSLPFIRRPLPHIVTSVVTQLVHNIEQLAGMYRAEGRSVTRGRGQVSQSLGQRAGQSVAGSEGR